MQPTSPLGPLAWIEQLLATAPDCQSCAFRRGGLEKVSTGSMSMPEPIRQAGFGPQVLSSVMR